MTEKKRPSRVNRAPTERSRVGLFLKDNKKKIFVIGFNKTATSTFNAMFRKNGLKSFHGTKWQLDEYGRLDKYDCFSDGEPIIADVERLEKRYANALFILNTRSLRKWLISRFQHGVTTLNARWRKKSIRGKYNWAYPPSTELAEKWIADRNNYYSDALNYFVDKPEKLIIVNVEEPGWIKYICEILKLEKTNIKSRKVTKTTKEIDKIINIVDLTFKNLGYDDKQQKVTLLNDNKKYLNIYRNNML